MITEAQKNINIVKEGYKKAARSYRDQKNRTQCELPIFQQFLHFSTLKRVLELGCATGFPIAKTILEYGIDYVGIDLSEVQINLARQEFSQWSEKFQIAEMLEFCRECPSSSFDGVISMFTIRHLPRIYHAELYTEIYRILQPNGYMLIDCAFEPDESFDDSWLGETKMFWSTFSKSWTMQTLKELNFQLLNSYEHNEYFNGALEKTLFLLYQKI